ncbi:tetratricopeptide repeat protein [Pseudoalteromonas sp. JBTF-M23]|uniref:Tetratricopeptide repeat protein n=1 Tax=Pseudoalteromonas caenipelagi TaxID=2726988 RepID=A0A849VIA9_9GAMM|nr:hypothetical protein [Pseudoalteromonas caenipelagi]NOU52213.1 tetratricopeptide repeat protein [Pseudoalteromonas caenipelagi]
MSITALLLSSLLMLPVSAAQLDELKKLSSSEPDKALQLYSQMLEQANTSTNKQAIIDLHYTGLLAALNSAQWATFERIVKRLYDAELSSYLEPMKFTLLTRIGVAYRYNNQLEQARMHYTCALAQSASDIEHSLLKVNLAIVYKLSDQPAMAFQLINSIDEKQLSMKVKAGYLVVRGNILTSLGKFEDALSSFEQAREQYGLLDDQLSKVGVTFNILGAALAYKSLDKFADYRTGIEVLLKEHDSQYLYWLDVIAQSIKTQVVTAVHEKWLIEHINPLLERGYGTAMKAHLEIIDMIQLYPKQKPKRRGDKSLAEFLGAPWCPKF